MLLDKKNKSRGSILIGSLAVVFTVMVVALVTKMVPLPGLNGKPTLSNTPLGMLSPTPSEIVLPTITDSPIQEINTPIPPAPTTEEAKVIPNTPTPKAKVIPTITNQPSPTIAKENVSQSQNLVTQPVSVGAQQLFDALNAYRQKNNVGTLAWDDKLAELARTRVNTFAALGDIDMHAGFDDFLQNNNGYVALGFASLGENSSFGNQVSATDIIENLYASSISHNQNQLNPNWTHAGVGVAGVMTNLIFGGNKY